MVLALSRVGGLARSGEREETIGEDLRVHSVIVARSINDDLHHEVGHGPDSSLQGGTIGMKMAACSEILKSSGVPSSRGSSVGRASLITITSTSSMLRV